MALTAGQRLTAALLNAFSVTTVQATGMPTSGDTQVTNGTTTSTSFTATLTGGTACGLAFTAPPSGRVLILSDCGVFNSSAANASLITIRVRTGASVGSGSDVVAASDDNAIAEWTANLIQVGNHYLATGLTPGSSYNVQQLYRVSAGTGNFQRKRLTVHPCI